MSKTQSPDSSTPKPKRGVGAMKEKYENRIAELEAALAAETEAGTVAVEPVTVPAPIVKKGGIPPYNEAEDPLAWIDETVDTVHLVGRIYGFRGRRAISDQRGSQDKTFMTAARSSQWVNCPFDFSAEDPFKQKEKEFLNKEWWIFPISRMFGEDCYSGIDGFPKSVVVSAKEFGGLDPHTGQPRGKRTLPSEDPLREIIRRILQENPKTMWLNDDYGNYVFDGYITKDKPNPYGTGIEAAAMARTMRQFERK